MYRPKKYCSNTVESSKYERTAGSQTMKVVRESATLEILSYQSNGDNDV